MLDPTLKSPYCVDQVGVTESAFPTNSQIMLRLLSGVVLILQEWPFWRLFSLAVWKPSFFRYWATSRISHFPSNYCVPVSGVKSCRALPYICLVGHLEGPPCIFLRLLLCATPSSLPASATEIAALAATKWNPCFLFDQQVCSLLWELFILRQQFECGQVENRRECGTQFWSYPSFMNYG